jgi:hypothetical protein
MAVSHDDIARVAYALFEARRHVHGHDLDDWLTAERALIASSSHIVMFIPFLRLKNSHRVAGVEFVPLRDQQHRITAFLAPVSGALLKILEGYIDRHGEPFDDCVVATIPGRGWDMTTADFPTVTWASSLLFLASWSENEYFHPFGGQYVNSTAFRAVGQAYTGASPVNIAVSARRRAGGSLDGGYEHGEFKFNMPVQVSVRDAGDVDEGLLAALDAANAANSLTIDRLRSALPFVELANTDDDLITEHAEAILMGSAFEQLLAGDASAYKLSKKFGALFGRFGNVTVRTAKAARADIELDPDPTRAAAQLSLWVHKKWIEELYDVRSKMVHKGKHLTRKWGWQLEEHLVIAALVFPLAVKLMLERDGHYTLTDDDHARCLAVDKLLAATGWGEQDKSGRTTVWDSIMSKSRLDYGFDKRWEKFKREHPGVLDASNVSRDPLFSSTKSR